MQVDEMPRLARPGPLLVELVGTPGSGKTSVAPGVHDALHRAGWETYSAESGARAVVSRTFVGRVVGRLPGRRLKSVLWWRIYTAHRWLGMMGVMFRRPGHFLRVAQYQRQRPKGALVHRRRVLHWYLRQAGAQHFYRRHAADGEAVVFDEGHVHRVVQLFSSPVDSGSEAEVSRYLDGVPRPDLLVAVRCSLTTCLRRIRRRGVWTRLQDRAESELNDFIERAEQVVDHAVRYALERRWSLVEVDNEEDDPTDLTARVAALLTDAVSTVTERDGSPTRPLYGLVVPRPGQLTRRIRGHVTPPAIPPAVVDEFLSRLGTAGTGRIGNLPLGRRSDSLWVATEMGRLVVRSYSEHWPEETIRHEHSLLVHLEKAGYPSTRLVAAPDGETVQVLDGRRLAAFRFAEGANLRGSFMSARSALDALHLSGRLLARLHSVTADLEPEGAHHLSLDSTDDGARLRSQLALLDELASIPQSADADHLKRSMGEMVDRLVFLHETLMEAEPYVAVIHGDYGLHNVLIRRDGVATVHDFELARRDWRLVDIVETLVPMRLTRGRAVLAGYRFEAGGEPSDWTHLGAVWEYHRLGGAVRAWESYVRRGETERLDVARRRLEEARRIAREGIDRWL